MTTILFILAAAIVGYAIYSIYSGKGPFSSKTPDYMTDKASSKQEEAESEQPVPVEQLPEETASATEAQGEPAAAEGEEQTAAIDPAKIMEFRNPETGETAANPSNYRFAKKWIKQALVDEGLLVKVYRNKELKGETDKKVKEALNQFKHLEKYHG